MTILIQCLLGFVYASLIEYVSHRYLLHGLGKKKTSFFHFHWKHHQIVRKHNFFDVEYKFPFWWSPNRYKELASLALLVIVHLPIYFISVYVVFGMIAYAVAYYLLHKYCHVFPEFGKRIIPWHFRHHMSHQQKSFGVVLPIWDWIFHTYEWEEKI